MYKMPGVRGGGIKKMPLRIIYMFHFTKNLWNLEKNYYGKP